MNDALSTCALFHYVRTKVIVFFSDFVRDPIHTGEET